ncbi:iron-containing alcohol dehydrogenase [Berryella wangjianweii]|uniref:Iron-containing alcohol dehydrogenase n=1 Tax=Berryella wangjianweii TaxID=2734634 RepID=A0A6M8J0Y3_9ACTN|nr:iron-containing alcohol dehydrogenase [Berryella wangjianweii]QKF07630.1 iron-containing alcohol dehydrogenase [Berryella wangjianweii]
MNSFTFHAPTRFCFGEGVVAQLGESVASCGWHRVLVVYGQGSVVRTGVLDQVARSLDQAGVSALQMGGARPNPEVSFVRAGIEQARAFQADAIVAVGGGSAIDAAKAIAFGVPYEGDVWDFFDKRVPIQAALPLAVVLTIPAAGSEGSSSCVISNDRLGRKVGASSDLIRPRMAFMDPTFTYSLPAYQTAAGVVDMIAHICERYFSGVGPVPVTDRIATGLICTLIEQAPRVLANPQDRDARASIMWAGTLAHNDLAGCGRSLTASGRAGGWESHGLEHEVSAHVPTVAHGAGLAVVMPWWMRYVWRTDPSRFLSFGREVFGIEPVDESDQAVTDAVEAAIDELQAFFVSLGMPRSLVDFGIGEEAIDAFVETLRITKGERFGAFQPLTMDDARAIYRSCFKPFTPPVWEEGEGDRGEAAV